MLHPILTVIAGCNGSGKSSFANALTWNSSPSFDYDKVYLEKYHSLLDSDIREIMAHNLARNVLEELTKQSIASNSNFCYETNFNSTPLYWPQLFKTHGYKLRLIFFCLNSIQEAKRRVQIRVENGGHFVPENEIVERYKLGFNSLNEYWAFFDEVYLFDTSAYKEKPRFLASIVEERLDEFTEFPNYLENLIPNIINLKNESST